MKLRLTFSVSPDLDRAVLDRWLSDAFGIRFEELGHVRGRDPQSNFLIASDAAFLLDRALRLSRELLLAGRIPAFAPTQVLALEPLADPSAGFGATLVLQVVDGIPVRWYEQAVLAAMDVSRKVSSNAFNDVLLGEVYRALEGRLVRPMRLDVATGKSTIPVLRVAHELGIPFFHLGMGVYQLGWGSKARRLDRSSSDRDSMIGSRLTSNKAIAARLIRQAGLPAPVHVVIEKPSEMAPAIEEIGFPLVVKPLDQERGEGVTVDVMDAQALSEAFERARKLTKSRRVIIERQVAGVCHRLFIAQGRLLYAVKRLPMSVQGDGRRNVVDLVAHECAAEARRPPWDRGEIRPIDELALQAMRNAGFGPQDIPEPGTWVPLRRIESTEWGGVDEEVTDRVHADNVAAAIHAAALFGLEVAGVDVITEDIAKPWYESGAIINEVNFAPLLGGADISRSHIPAFLRGMMDGDGRIPVEFFGPGAEEMASAEARRLHFLGRGVRVFHTTAALTLGPDGKEVCFPFSRLSERVRALLLRKDVDAIIAVR